MGDPFEHCQILQCWNIENNVYKFSELTCISTGSRWTKAWRSRHFPLPAARMLSENVSKMKYKQKAVWKSSIILKRWLVPLSIDANFRKYNRAQRFERGIARNEKSARNSDDAVSTVGSEMSVGSEQLFAYTHDDSDKAKLTVRADRPDAVQIG